MQEFIMLIGLPAVGKTTITEEYASKGYKVISEELFGDASDQSNNQLVFNTMHDLVLLSLKNGFSVVYDATNVVSKRRRNYLYGLKQWTSNNLKDSQIVFKAILVLAPYNVCVQRDRKRERSVGWSVIDKMYRAFQPPCLQEGWDSIELKYTSEEMIDVPKVMKFLNTIEQHNQHHTFTIGEHCYNASMDIPKSNYNLFIATRLHDIGKAYTQQFRNSKGEFDMEAHYYNHENIGAYDVLFYKREWIKKLDYLHVSNLIAYHMMPFSLDSEKSRQRFIDFVGEKFWGELLLLHQADKGAR